MLTDGQNNGVDDPGRVPGGANVYFAVSVPLQQMSFSGLDEFLDGTIVVENRRGPEKEIDRRPLLCKL